MFGNAATAMMTALKTTRMIRLKAILSEKEDLCTYLIKKRLASHCLESKRNSILIHGSKYTSKYKITSLIGYGFFYENASHFMPEDHKPKF